MRHRTMLTVVLLSGLLAGCSATVSLSPSRSTSQPPAVLAKAPPLPSTLRPVATSTTLGPSGTTTLTAPLTGEGEDTITVRTTPGGDGQVKVTAGSAIIFQKQHVGGASVLEFGNAHLPVLLLQDSYNLCGSGGCVTSAYTWSAARQAMVVVPQPGATAYLYTPARRQFRETTVPQVGSLFGYIVPGSRGIVLTARTYDAWQHYLSQSYAYAPDLSPTGGWVPVGQPQFGPAGSQPASTFSDPGQALLALLSARSLDFRPQVRQLAATAAAQAALWQDLQPIAQWQGSLFAILPSPQVQSSASTATASDRISGLVGTGPQARLEVYEVTAELTRSGSGYLVTSAHLAPLAVKVRSVVQVLTLIRSRATLRKALAAAGDPPLLIWAAGQEWQVSLASRGSTRVHPWIVIDAVTGAVRKGT